MINYDSIIYYARWSCNARKIPPQPTREDQAARIHHSELERLASPGRALLQISEYRDKNRLTPFFSLWQREEIAGERNILTHPIDTATSEDEIRRINTVIGFELARQLIPSTPARLPARAREDGNAGFDRILPAYLAVLTQAGELRQHNPEAYQQELRRAAALYKHESPDQLTETSLRAFEPILDAAGRMIAKKVEALHGYHG